MFRIIGIGAFALRVSSQIRRRDIPGLLFTKESSSLFVLSSSAYPPRWRETKKLRFNPSRPQLPTAPLLAVLE